MNKTLSILMLAALPALALAAGSHAGDHPTHDHPAQPGPDAAATATHGHDDGHSHASLVGKRGDPAAASRTVDVAMDDSMRFTPSRISVKKGETVRFFLKNTGKLPHEMVIGTEGEFEAHAEMMRKTPDMPHHAQANGTLLAPGQRGGLVWQFDQAGTVDFACLVPGHLEAGMVGQVEVD